MSSDPRVVDLLRRLVEIRAWNHDEASDARRAYNLIADEAAAWLFSTDLRPAADAMSAQDGWRPIETCSEKGDAVLIYSPLLANDDEFPGHPIHISNRAYVACGNASKFGFTHWMPLPPAPSPTEGQDDG